MSRLFAGALAVIVASVGLWSADSRAMAGTTPGCIVFDVSFTTWNQQLFLHCNGDGKTYEAYYSSNGGDGCTPKTLSQIRSWSEMITAAHIARKPLRIDWSTPGPSNPVCIDAIWLNR